MHKCYACGRPGHSARDKVCPTRGKLCAKCGKRGHWATCCRNEADGKRYRVRVMEEEVKVIIADPVVLPVDVI